MCRLLSIDRSLRIALAASLCAGGPLWSQQAGNVEKAAAAYLDGARALDRQELGAAQSAFEQAVRLAPQRQEYALAVHVTRDRRISDLIQQAAKARLNHDLKHADALLEQARHLDPANELVLEHTAPNVQAFQAREDRIQPSNDFNFAAPIQIIPQPGTHDLHLRGDVRQIVTQTASSFGVKVVFDDSVTPQDMRFDLGQTLYTEAMPILLRIAHLFAVAVDSKTLLVVKDTQDNRTKFERLAEETIYVPATTPEQLNEISNVVKNVFDIKQAVVSPTLGALTLRAPEATLHAVNITLHDLLEGNAEVVLELKLMAIDKTRGRNTGTAPPSAFGAFSVAAEAQGLVNANQSVIQQAIASGALTLPPGNTAAQNILLEAVFLIGSGLATDAKLTGLLGTIGGGLTLLGVNSTGTTTINFGLNTSEARALDDISVRVQDHQSTVLRVGSKYPITSSTFSSGVSNATLSSLAGKTIGGLPAQQVLNQYTGAGSVATTPIIQYEDLGITLKATPAVLRSGLISVHIDLKIQALTGASLDNIPILTSRAFVSDITVADGASALMLSTLSRAESSSLTGFPGLSDLPGFRQSAADTLRETDSSELVLLVTPHLARARKNNLAGPRIAFSTSVPQEN